MHFPFHSYFDSEDPDTIIDFSKVFKQLEQGEIVVMDQIGKFLNFFVICVQIGMEKDLVDEENFQLANLQRILKKLVEKVCEISMEKLGVYSVIDFKGNETISQYLNCLQALMVHCSYDLSDENITHINRMFEKHQSITTEATKISENAKKSLKKGKNQSEISVATGKKVEINFDCLWDLKTCGTFLKIFFEPNLNEKINEIKQNSQLCRFVLKSIGQNFLHLSTSSDRLKFKHSRTTFSAVGEFSLIIYKQMKLNLFNKLHSDFDNECAVEISEAFKSSIVTINEIYNSPQMWREFLEKLTGIKNNVDLAIHEILKVIQSIVDWAFDSEDLHHEAAQGEKIIVNLFTTMEILFRKFQTLPNQYAKDAYTWLLRFCTTNEIQQKNLHIVNRVLFSFMVQQDAGCTMEEVIAHRISSVYKLLDDEIEAPEAASQNELLSITETTVDQAFFAFAAVIKRQIDDVEFCIARLNSFNAILKIPGQPSRNESAEAMKVLEMSIVIKLAGLGKIIGRLCNSRFSVIGMQIETIGRIVINYFLCLTNLMRHFNQHFDVKTVDCQFIPVEMLIKEVKNTVKRAYALSPYIEQLYEGEQKKTVKGKSKKTVVVKELKYTSRLVGAAEKFANIVQKFDKLAGKNFSRNLHYGEVRSLRINDNQDVEENASEKDSSDTSDSDKSSEPSTNSSKQTRKSKKNPRKRIFSTDESDTSSSDDEMNKSLKIILQKPEKNLQKINEKAKKKEAKQKKK